MPSCFRTKEREFIRDLMEWNVEKLHKKYTPSYRRILKYRILQKRGFMADDLLLINSVFDKLQAI